MEETSRQQQLESHAMAEGQRLFRERLEKAEGSGQSATVGAGLSLVRSGIEPLSLAVEHILREALKARGPKHIIVKTVPQLVELPKQKEEETDEAYAARLEKTADARLTQACDIAAYMTLRVVLNAALSRTLVTTVAYEVADLLTDQIRYNRLQEEAPRLFEYKMKSFATSNYDHRSRSLDATLRFAKIRQQDGSELPIDVTDVELTDAQRLALGMKLIDLLIQSTELVEETEGEPTKRSRKFRQAGKYLQATQDTLTWLDSGNQRLEFLTPVALPMVEQPVPWAPGERGGYRYALRNKYQFVRRVTKGHAKVLAEAQMPVIYDAVNKIQNTAWRINTDVLGLIEEIVQRGGGMAGVPELRHVDTPGKPAEIEGYDRILKARRKELREAQRRGESAELSPLTPELAHYAEVWRTWRKKTAAVIDGNHERSLARKDMDRLLVVAQRFKDDPAMYFVWNLDFRGRIYPVTGNSGISPQGNDKGKALLTFSHGKPLGRDGVRYLAQHGMSCLGETPDGTKVSKMTIEQRVQWVRDNQTFLWQAARDPFSFTWWMGKDVDEPLMFYAFCCEWVRLQDWCIAGNPEETFVSSLPCFTDGSCNGLQHFGGLLACEETGKAVNLIATTPGMTPADIYNAVMDKAKAIIVADAANPDNQKSTTSTTTRQNVQRKWVTSSTVMPAIGELAQLWITSGLLTRSLFKRPVMTFPYGSKVFGFRSQFLNTLAHQGDNVQESKRLAEITKRHFSSAEALAKATEKGETKAPGDLLNPAAAYLASVTMSAIEGTVVKAAEGMRWLQKAARLVAGNAQCASWTVPATGFKVRQEYFESNVKQVETVLCGKVYRPRVYEATAKPKVHKQANSMSPNFIHSLDAAALMLTVQAAAQDGVESFAMIHDSYGAPAGDCAVLARAARQSFVNLYTKQDVIGGLRDELLTQINPDKADALVENMPVRGALDVAGVLASDFFFA